MKFNELEEARAKRAEKEAIKEAKDKAKHARKEKASQGEAAKNKAKRGRKRKGSLDTDIPKKKVAKRSEVQDEEGELALVWKAPEAQIEIELPPTKSVTKSA
ncbi:hypothetical protein GQ44DRAFT_769679 [Phaeosphaeriaceae sp. PMI808]|nr:hypothetical protein GQ44DRAFT_769679 [Phaeosphaeriaceae sp. PMI808]